MLCGYANSIPRVTDAWLCKTEGLGYERFLVQIQATTTFVLKKWIEDESGYHVDVILKL